MNAQSVGNPVRYGFIGTGTEGCTLLKFLATIPEGRCIATCDIYPPNLKKGVETIGSNPETYVEYRKMLERKDMDAVFIATPLNLHAQMVVDALNAGKHVFVEKTMYFKEEEGDLIRKAMDDHPKQVLQVGLQRRSSVLYQVAMEMIRKGALGKVMFVRAQWDRNSNWRRPVPDPKFERLINWRMYKEYFGRDDGGTGLAPDRRRQLGHRRGASFGHRHRGHRLLERRARNLRQCACHLRISGRARR